MQELSKDLIDLINTALLCYFEHKNYKLDDEHLVNEWCDYLKSILFPCDELLSAYSILSVAVKESQPSINDIMDNLLEHTGD